MKPEAAATTGNEPVIPMQDAEKTSSSADEFVSILPQQLSVGGQVLIAPPIDLISPDLNAQKNVQNIAVADTGTQEPADAAVGLTRQVSIPELVSSFYFILKGLCSLSFN